jgi:hypothetical protein
MRRAVSVILFIFGGWMLTGEAMLAWVNFGVTGAEQLMAIGLMALFAAPFLLLGLWASPGKRLAELGITVMIAAGIGATLALALATMVSDPGFKQLMPPGKPLPPMHFAFASGVLNLLVVGGLGLICWWFGRGREPARSGSQV